MIQEKFVADLHAELGIDPDRVSVELMTEIFQSALSQHGLALTLVAGDPRPYDGTPGWLCDRLEAWMPRNRLGACSPA